jgi:hypothetical protein
MDALGGFTNAQHQVVVLRAFEPGPHAAHLPKQAAPDHREMAQVLETQEQLGRPLGLELRRKAPALDVDLVVVTVQEIDLRVLADATSASASGSSSSS